MKHITQQEALQLIKDKKISPHVLKPYKEEDIKEDVDNEVRLIDAIYALVSQLANSDNSKGIVEAIGNLPAPEVKVENVIEKEDKKPEKWEFEIERDEENYIKKIVATSEV